MIKDKKAQGLTLNTVVIAVLVLVVLGVLLFIVYKYIYGAGSDIGQLSSCEARGEGEAECVAKGDCKDGTAFYMMGGCGKGDNKDQKYCCIPNEK